MVGPDYLRPLFRIFALRVVKLRDASARRTDATCFMVLRRAAVQSTRNFERKEFLADAFFAREQQCAGQPIR